MKFLYCPKCKELRVKPWYSLKDRCTRCRGDVRVIKIPPTPYTYVVYFTMTVSFALLYLYSRNDDALYLYVAIVFAVAMAAAQVVDMVKGERYAKSKIKVTQSDTKSMRGKGWE